MRHPVVDTKRGRAYIDPVNGFYVELIGKPKESYQDKVGQFREEGVVGLRHPIVCVKTGIVFFDPVNGFYFDPANTSAQKLKSYRESMSQYKE